MPDLTIGDILKSEADPNNRIAIPAPAGTKTGQPVKYAARDEYLFALTDEVNGEVLVQPHNCVMYLDPILQADIDAVFTDVVLAIERRRHDVGRGEDVGEGQDVDGQLAAIGQHADHAAGVGRGAPVLSRGVAEAGIEARALADHL